MAIWACQWVGFALLAGALYFTSGNFVNYWPLGVLQAGLILIMPILLRQGRNFSCLVLGVCLGLLSLALGFALVLFELQAIRTWRASVYLLIHVLWIFVFIRAFLRVQVPFCMHFAIAGCLLAICLVNSGDPFDSQRVIAFLELLLFLLAVFVFEKELLQARQLLLWAACVAMVLVLSNFMAIQEGVGLADWWRAGQIIAHFLLATVIWVWLCREGHALAWLAMTVGLAISVYTLLLLAAWFGMDEPAQYDWIRNPPLFAHIRHVGYFMCIGTVIGAWAVLVTRGSLQWLAWLIYVLALAVLLWSGGRGPFLASFVGVMLLLYMAPLRSNWRSWRGLFVGLLLGFLLPILFPVDQPSMGWMSAWRRSGAAESLDALSSSRLMVWAYLCEFIALRPLFGWGGEGFLAVWNGFPIIQAHNGLLQVMIEWGSLGAAVIFIPLAILTSRGFCGYLSSKAEDRKMSGFGGALVAALLVFSLVDGIFYYGLPLAFLVVGYTALIAGLGSQERVRHPDSLDSRAT